MTTKILIADQDESSRAAIRETIEVLGFTSIVVPSGSLTQEILRFNPNFDLLIIDAALPDIGGKELTRLLRRNKDFADLPIIIVSGKTRIKEINEMLELGASYFVPKPINLEQLRELVGKLISRKKLREKTQNGR